MPFCDWCQLESDTPEFCAWCKRPLRAKSVYGSFDYVREVDASSPAERAMPLFAGIVLIGFMVALGFAIANSTKEPVAKEPAVQDVAEYGGSSTAAAEPAPRSSAPAANTAYTPPTPPRQQSPNVPTGYGTPGTTLPYMGRPSQALANSEGGVSASLDVSKARFRLARGTDGGYILYGEADLTNTGNEPIKQARFQLSIEDETLILDVYEGEIHNPKINHGPEIPMGNSTVFLINRSVPQSVLKSGIKSLTVTGRNSNGPLSGGVSLELQN
jgi:hypothetical protein